jgi:poly(hydroxyalkanoate) depolymerase family esterase
MHLVPSTEVSDSGAAAPSPTRRASTADHISATIERALTAAGLAPSGILRGVTDTINKALSSAGLVRNAESWPARAETLVGVSRELPGFVVENADKRGVDAPESGRFVARSFSNAAGTRLYKLYMPTGVDPATQMMPMVLMLHGCTQTPDDFAAGTQMNALADKHGFLVVYPAQPAKANGMRCWNWFRAGDQARDGGEPSLLAGITREVASEYNVDPRRIFVAGMSAGAAMAVVLGATYPDLFAAVGAHSGLPYRSAHDVGSALGAMNGAHLRATGADGHEPLPDASGLVSGRRTPTIVFHGDQDHTVNARNGSAIAAAAVAMTASAGALDMTEHAGQTPSGRTYTRRTYTDPANRSTVEHWLLHGAGHAWSGGSAEGSYTDPMGPDASAEMIRFFYAQ